MARQRDRNVVQYAGVAVDLDTLQTADVDRDGKLTSSWQSATGRLAHAIDRHGIVDWNAWASIPRDGFGQMQFSEMPALEGVYSAHAWLKKHTYDVHRFITDRLHPHERDGRKLDLWNRPTKFRQLVVDHARPLEEKLDSVVKFIGTSESAITTVNGARGGGKSTTVAILADLVRTKYDRDIAYLDHRPKNKLPHFAARRVDIGALQPGEICVIDESARLFSHRQSMKGHSITLPVILAALRHREISALAISPSSLLTDKTWDVLSDAQIVKPSSLNQGEHARPGEARLYRDFEEMLPPDMPKEWGVFVASRVPPTTFCLPYVHCKHGIASPHAYACCIPPWWTVEMSRSHIVPACSPFRWHDDYSPDAAELALDLLYWGRPLQQIKDTMDMAGCAGFELRDWATFFRTECTGDDGVARHPRTKMPLFFPEIDPKRRREDEDEEAYPPRFNPREALKEARERGPA